MLKRTVAIALFLFLFSTLAYPVIAATLSVNKVFVEQSADEIFVGLLNHRSDDKVFVEILNHLNTDQVFVEILNHYSDDEVFAALEKLNHLDDDEILYLLEQMEPRNVLCFIGLHNRTRTAIDSVTWHWNTPAPHPSGCYIRTTFADVCTWCFDQQNIRYDYQYLNCG